MTGQAGTPAPASVVLMGVSGSGKTAVGRELAAALGWRFADGDRFHPPENIARMASGLPLRDEDRWGWLDAIGAEIARAEAEGGGLVVACSALKRVYRDRLRGAGARVRFVFLAIDRDTAARRVAARRDHFMPASLIDSQFAALEPPGADEHPLLLDASLDIAAIVATAAKQLAVRATAIQD